MSNKQLEQDALAQLRARLMQQGHRTYKDEYVSPIRGVTTGHDQAFVVDRKTRDALEQQAPKLASMLKPYILEKDVGKWFAREPGQWVLHIPANASDIEQMPVLKQHLAPFKEQLEHRGAQQKWFESQPAETEHAKVAASPKIVCLHEAGRLKFSLDRSGAHVSGEGYVIPFEDYFLMGSLNSKLYGLLLQGVTGSGDAPERVQIEHIEALPFPIPLVENRGFIGQNSEYCMKLSMEREEFREYMCGEILSNLGKNDGSETLSPQLVNWHLLDVLSFRNEVRRHFGREIPEDMVPAWDAFLDEGKVQLSRMMVDLERSERQIDVEVYEMFGLTEEEIELMNGV